MFVCPKSELAKHFTLLLRPEEEIPLMPELALVLAAVSALPDGSYCVYDDQADGMAIPQWLFVLQEVQCAAWSGEEENSMGYGGISVSSTKHGPILNVWLAGSSLQSASSIYVVPEEAHKIAQYS